MPDRQLSVLVVEDDRDTRELTEEVFRAQGFEVLLADSVSSASKILETFMGFVTLASIMLWLR